MNFPQMFVFNLLIGTEKLKLNLNVLHITQLM